MPSLHKKETGRGNAAALLVLRAEGPQPLFLQRCATGRLPGCCCAGLLIFATLRLILSLFRSQRNAEYCYFLDQKKVTKD